MRGSQVKEGMSQDLRKRLFMRITTAFLSFAFLCPAPVLAQTLQETRTKAQQGDSLAQYNLGARYAKGDGVAKDDEQAVHWYRKAAEQGNAKAQYNMGIKYSGHALWASVARDDMQAYKWLSLAASNGHRHAERYLDRIARKLSPSQMKAVQKEIAAQYPTVTKTTKTTNKTDAAVKTASEPSAPMHSLNETLREAMALYYDNQFSLAFPLLQKISDQVDSTDVRFWLGMSALKTAQLELAISQFKAILDKAPEQHQARMELAVAFMQKKDREAAKQQLLILQKSNPPDAIARQITHMLKKITGIDRRYAANIRLFAGIQNDTNINSQPEDRFSATLPSPNPDQSIGLVSGGSAGFVYDIGAKGGFVWRNVVDHYHLDHLDHGNNDYNQSSMQSTLERHGLKWGSRTLLAKMNVGMVDRNYAHAALSDSWYLQPQARIQQGRGDATVSYKFEKETFDQPASKLQNNHTQALSLSLSWRLSPPSTPLKMASLVTRYTVRGADADRFSFKDWSIGPAYARHFDWGGDLAIRGQYLHRNYDGNITNLPGLLFPGQRRDERFSLGVSLSKAILEKYIVSANYAFTTNDSNTELYDYSKNVLGLTLSTNWEF